MSLEIFIKARDKTFKELNRYFVSHEKKPLINNNEYINKVIETTIKDLDRTRFENLETLYLNQERELQNGQLKAIADGLFKKSEAMWRKEESIMYKRMTLNIFKEIYSVNGKTSVNLVSDFKKYKSSTGGND